MDSGEVMADEGIACPVVIGNPEAELVERIGRREAERAVRRRAEKNDSTVRENICCRESLDQEGRKCQPLEALEAMMREAGQCILQHASFHKVVLDPEVLRMVMRTVRFERKLTKKPVEDENRSLRYCAYRSFVFWCYGQLGMNRRFELPACVRGAIMKAYPSSSGIYVGFKEAAEGHGTAECDYEEWRESTEL
ncbi:hypothetical protein GCK32_001243 [Trichostrongylus colubriformis]|uniref:P2X purinoreceptor 7 intracellular domain-containing protein n=1 Tax=Trichostrongylus colubriformis TaxID=6319 RepID=A0AAN8G5T6_TRICO